MNPIIRVPLLLLALAVTALFGGINSLAAEKKAEISTFRKQQILKGEWYFERNCAFCHGKEGRGLIGPNLTDHYFIYGTDRKTVEKIITNGLPEKGMPNWSSILPKDQLTAIAEYVWSLRGRDLEGKAAEGILHKL